MKMSLKILTLKYIVVMLMISSIYFLYLSFFEINRVTVRLVIPSDRPNGSSRISCQCSSRSRSLEALEESMDESACDKSATGRGRNQKVISYSLTESNLEIALKNVEINANSIATWLPLWIIRVYHNVNITDPYQAQQLCMTWCRYPNVDFCQVSDLPPPLYDQSNIFNSVWKFLVLGDPLVERFMISDENSVIGEAHVDSIQRWIQSNESWIFMQYHSISHSLPSFVGVLGGVNDNRSLNIELRNRLIDGQTMILDKQPVN